MARNWCPAMTTPHDILVRFRPDALPEVPSPGADRLTIDLQAITLIDSRLIERLLQIVHAVHPAHVCVRQACTRVYVQLRQLGFDRIFTIERA